jgi:cell division septation protein DedD
MSTTGCATPTAPPDSQNEAIERPSNRASKRLKALLTGFAGTVTIGLGLAVWYVDLRIVATPPKTSTSTLAPAAPKTASAPLPAMPVPAPVPAPQAGEADLYLQVGGLGRHETAWYLKSLRANGFQAEAQSDGETDATKIMIGPFSSHAELEKARRELKSVGMLALETKASLDGVPQVGVVPQADAAP